MSTTKRVLSVEALQAALDATAAAELAANNAASAANDAADAATTAATNLTDFMVNVKDFGALGDGSEATAAFVAAEAALPATGGAIFVPDGIYTVAFRLKKDNVHIVGQSWNAVLKARSGYSQFIDDCPLRIFGDYCQVRNLKIDGNIEGNPQVTTDALAEKADGIGIFSNYCVVENCHVTNCYGHHIIVWNDNFDDESWPSAARHHNSIRYCLIDEIGLRNPLDFASTKDLGSDFDQKINYNNDMIGNIVVGGNLVIHTGWDTRIIGNTVVNGSISCHTSCRRVLVQNNNVINGNMTLRGGLTSVVGEARRRSKDYIVIGNKILDSVGGAIALLYVDGGIVSDNLIVNAATDGIQMNSVSEINVTNNVIRGTGAQGIQQPATLESTPNTWDRVNIRGNDISAVTTIGIQATGICVNSVIESNKITDGVNGIIISNASSQKVKISNNYLISTSGSSMILLATKTVVTGNTIYDSGSSGIQIDGNDMTVENNYIDGCQRGFSYPSTPTTGGILRFNTVKNASVEAVRRLPATEIVFANIGITNQNA